MGSRITDYLEFAGTGEVSGSLTAKQLPDIPCRGVTFKAAADNAGIIYIGAAGVTVPDGTTDATSGWPLAAGAETAYWPCSNLNEFYIIGTATTDDVSYIYWL